VQYYGHDGKLMTQSLEDFTKQNVLKQFKSLNDFLNKWKSAEKKKAIIEELEEQGVLLFELQKEVEHKTGKDLDPFDLICHVAFEMPPLTRKERAENVKKRNYFARYGENARQVLENLLEKYADEGVENIESLQILKLEPLNDFGTPREIFKYFGDKQDYLKAIKELENEIYRTA
jgi:type I restriction enzyme R subunit